MTAETLILDLSRVYADEGWIARLGDTAVCLDLSAIDGTTCYCDPAAEAQIRSAVAGRTERIHWIDSGDYHYLTKILSDALATEPFTLVIFDNHPDDQAPAFDGEMLSCGGWVRSMQEGSRFLERVIVVGPDGAKPALDVDGKAVWVSLDKDILSKDYARTDWSQGDMSLEELTGMLETVFTKSARVLGVDICGEFPPAKGGSPEDQRINLATNIAIQEFIINHIN